MIRCIITGITTMASQRCSLSTSSDPAGSNFRVSTSVEPSSMARLRWAQPQVWNSGAAM